MAVYIHPEKAAIQRLIVFHSIPSFRMSSVEWYERYIWGGGDILDDEVK
jgi:hypothetical protein